MNQIRFALQRPSKVLPILVIVAFMLASPGAIGVGRRKTG